MKKRFVFVILGLSACATSPTGRQQLHLVSDGEMAKMGAASFDQMKAQTPIAREPAINAQVRCVARAITGALSPTSALPADWEVVVFQDESPNAFALPGGKIGVQTGIFKVARTPDQLATVLGHEVSHVIARHGDARISQQLATQGGLELLGALAATSDPAKAETRKLLLAALGVGAQVGITLPYSRADESEADRMGLELMARAGFDPHGALELWQNMDKLGGTPPEFLSDHPSNGHRIEDIQARMPQAMALYQAAANSGRHPACPTAPVAQSAR